MNETFNVAPALSTFSPISLEEMSTIRLMNRTDTKYIVSLPVLMDVLRWTLGTEWKLCKKHSLDFYYLYQNKADDDEANGHVVGAGYSFKF